MLYFKKQILISFLFLYSFSLVYGKIEDAGSREILKDTFQKKEELALPTKKSKEKKKNFNEDIQNPFVKPPKPPLQISNKHFFLQEQLKFLSIARSQIDKQQKELRNQQHFLEEIVLKKERKFFQEQEKLSNEESLYKDKLLSAFQILQEENVIKQENFNLGSLETIVEVESKEQFSLPGIPNMEINPVTKLAEKQKEAMKKAKSKAEEVLEKGRVKIVSLKDKQVKKISLEKELSNKRIDSQESKVAKLEVSLQKKLEKAVSNLDLIKKREKKSLESLQNSQEKKLGLRELQSLKRIELERKKLDKLKAKQNVKLEKAKLKGKDRKYISQLKSRMKKELLRAEKAFKNKTLLEKKKLSSLKNEHKKILRFRKLKSNKKIAAETKKINILKKNNKKKIIIADKTLKKLKKNESKKIKNLEKKQEKQLNVMKGGLEKEKISQEKKLIRLEKKQKSDLIKMEISWKKERDLVRQKLVKKNKGFLKKLKKQVSSENRKILNAYRKKSKEGRIKEIQESIDRKVDVILDEVDVYGSESSFLNKRTFANVWDEFVQGLDLEKVYQTAENRMSSSIDSIKNQGFELFSTGVNLSRDVENRASVKMFYPQNQSFVFLGSSLDVYIPKNGGNLFSYEVLPKESVFISKDAFFSQIDSANKHVNFSLPSSFIAGIPGLDDMLYSGWGIWAVQDTARFNQWNFGYLGFGNVAHETSLRDMNQLKREADRLIKKGFSPIVNYSGSSMGSVFNVGEKPKIEFGTASMGVNFSSGTVLGIIKFQKDLINLKGKVSGASFAGSSNLNGSGQGSFQGAFFGPMAQESVGTFGAQSQGRQAIGAFGMSKEE